VKATLPAMTEAQLQANVLEMAKLLGIRTAHFRPGLTQAGNWITAVAGDGKGWPDVVFAGRRLLIRELKGVGGKVSAEQTAWIAALVAAGVDAGIWWPKDWVSGLVQAELRAISPKTPAATAGSQIPRREP
jgi:hypothetical protein